MLLRREGFMEKYLVSYLIVVNTATFIISGLDKLAAIRRKWRVPEKKLLFLALIKGVPILVNSDQRSYIIRPSIPEISGHRSYSIRPPLLFEPAKCRHLMPGV
jgi:hypothetical protein